MRSARGFTLLEVLVVLIITVLLTTILFQGLRQVLRIQSYFGVETFNSQNRAMQAAWFRQTVNALVPDFSNGEHKFRGSAREFAGQTLAALDAPEAAIVPFTWRLRFDSARGVTELQYGSDESAPVIMRWSGEAGRFAFIDASGIEHDTWPPFLGRWPQLPSAIRLHAIHGSESGILVAVPKGPAETPVRRRNLEND